MHVTQRRIDDQIIVLCGKVTQAPDGEREVILQELLHLIHQKIERLERRAASVFLNFEGFYERRITSVNTQVPNSNKTSDAA
jgi:hypothetical protein